MNLQEFLDIWQAQATCDTVLEYRLYYDEQGWPLHYSTQQEPGNYIVVDQETYSNGAKHVRVVGGKIKTFQVVFGKKLAPSSQGQACHPSDVAVVVASDQPHCCWQIKHEEPVDD